MNQFNYNSDLIGGSLMVRESRIIADLLISGANPDEWNRYVMVDNLLQKRSAASAKRIAQAIRITQGKESKGLMELPIVAPEVL